MTTEQVLWECFRYFAYMDKSNASIHCASVRYSPITFRLAEQLDQLGALDRSDSEQFNMLSRVLEAAGKYAEDGGR